MSIKVKLGDLDSSPMLGGKPMTVRAFKQALDHLLLALDLDGNTIQTYRAVVNALEVEVGN